MEVLAKIKFMDKGELKDIRYLDGAWPFISYSSDSLAGCRLSIDKEAFAGDEVEIGLTFIDASVHRGKVKEGESLKLYAGSHLMAEGEFTVVYDPAM